MKALVRALRLLNEDAYTSRLRMPASLSSGAASVPGNLPCQPLAPPPFLASHIKEKLHQVDNYFLFHGFITTNTSKVDIFRKRAFMIAMKGWQINNLLIFLTDWQINGSHKIHAVSSWNGTEIPGIDWLILDTSLQNMIQKFDVIILLLQSGICIKF